MYWLKSLPSSYRYVSHPQEGSQEVPAEVRVGVKAVAVLSGVFLPKTAQEFVRTIPVWREPQSQASLRTCST